MKKLIVFLLVLILAVPVVAFGQVHVRGYWQDRDGDGYKETPVRPYQRTYPDHNPYNNYSSPGNQNPYTGQIAPQPAPNPYYYGSPPRGSRW